MAQYYDYEGFVEEVGETQVVGKNGFTKRDVLLGDELNPTSQWPHRIAFTMKKDNCSLLDGVQKGQRTKVRFAIDSRVWNDPKTGKNRFFTDLTALKFEIVNGDGTSVEPVPQPPEAPESAGDAGDPDDLPF